jgi:hypothetical protein
LHAIYVMEQLQIADEKNAPIQPVDKKIVKPYLSKVQFTSSE